MKKRLILYFNKKLALKNEADKVYSESYDEKYNKWQKNVEKNENSNRKKQKDSKQRECYEKLFPELRKQREERERVLSKYFKFLFFLFYFILLNIICLRQFGRNISNLNKNEDDIIDIYDYDLIMSEDDRKRLHQLAVIPPLCFDNKQRRYKFINNNGYIQDPMALFKSNQYNQVFWSEKEREIFLEKLLLYGKNFELIASFLEKKVIYLFYLFIM